MKKSKKMENIGSILTKSRKELADSPAKIGTAFSAMTLLIKIQHRATSERRNASC